jgi:hypothetical protein
MTRMHAATTSDRQLAAMARATLVLGVALRLYVAVVNAEANDDHLSVIRLIADEHRLPRLRDAWEGFQPKLYHVPVAILWELNPVDSNALDIRIAQLVSAAAGIATLFVLRRALQRHAWSEPVRLVAFAFVALNPKFIGLSGQATNDSFVILFCTIALDQGAVFFGTGRRRSFAIMTIASVLAALSKGNGLVLVLAVVIMFARALLSRGSANAMTRRENARYALAYVGIVLVLVTALGSYRANYEDAGTPFATNAPSAPRPHLIEKTYVFRPGTTSVVDSFFTFRFVDMMRHPTITNGKDDYPLHRTSLWSQLYGRTHYVHFDQFPPSWRNTSLPVLTIGRAVLILALLPTGVMLGGMAAAGAEAIRSLRRRRERVRDPGQELFLLAGLGFVGLVVMYSYTRRDFSTMKAEFIFPAVLAYASFFARGLEWAMGWTRSRPAVRWIGGLALAALLGLYVLDVVILAVDLT